MNKEDIILFGASRLGEIAFNVLKDRFNIRNFSDNDKSKWGKFFCGTKIIGPEELVNFKGTKIIIASLYYGEISVQLKSMGLDNIHIFSYADSNDKTYSKKYFIDKMCDLDTYNKLKLDLDFKNKFVDNFSLIYSKKLNVKKNIKTKQSSSKKNVLVIAYAFPPIGGSGVQRTLKFAKYLEKYGWNPIVLTVGEEYCSIEKDYSLVGEIPESVKIYRINHSYVNSEQLNHEIVQQIFNLIYGVIDDEYVAMQHISRIKENNCAGRSRIFEPDQYISWANNVLRDVEKILDINEMDLIYTTSDPYSNNFIGYYIKRKYNIPWVADFRDEWTNNPYGKDFYKDDEFRLQLHRCMEQKVVDFADKVVTVTPIASENYRSIFNLPRDKVVTITNGYDEEDFNHITKNKTRNKKLNILYYGTLYLNRTLENVIVPINELIEDSLINKELVEIRIIGKVDLSIKSKLKQLDKYNIIKFTSYLSHLECLKEANKGNLLLLPFGEGDAFKAGYTGKVFEYIRLMVPILALSPKGSEVEELLNETRCGENFEYDDLSGIKNYILQQYKNWLLGEHGFFVNETKIKEFERTRLTEKLSEVFNSLL